MNKIDVQDKIIEVVLYVLMFVSFCGFVTTWVERQKIVEQIEQHEANLAELLTEN